MSGFPRRGRCVDADIGYSHFVHTKILNLNESVDSLCVKRIGGIYFFSPIRLGITSSGYQGCTAVVYLKLVDIAVRFLTKEEESLKISFDSVA